MVQADKLYAIGYCFGGAGVLELFRSWPATPGLLGGLFRAQLLHVTPLHRHEHSAALDTCGRQQRAALLACRRGRVPCWTADHERHQGQAGEPAEGGGVQRRR